MKRTQILDAFRNIKKQLISFLSIAIVTSLGVGIFLACRFGAEALRERANDYYQESAWRDLEIRATMGISEEDVAAAADLPGVIRAEGVFAMDMAVQAEEAASLAHVVSLTQEIDRFRILEGRAPQAADECVLVPELAEHLKVGVGDRVELSGKTQDSFYLKGTAYTVTGIIRHPDHYRAGLDTVYNLMIMPQAVDADALKSPYTGILLSADADADTFTEAYQADIVRLMEQTADFGEQRNAERYEKLRADADAQLEENEKKLADAKAELEKGQEELARNEQKLEDAKAELEKGAQDLENGKKELAEKEDELKKSRKQLDDVKAQLDDGKKQLDETKGQLDNAAAELAQGRQQLDNAAAQLQETKNTLDASKAQLDAGYGALIQKKQELDAAQALLAEGRARLDEKEQEAEAALSEQYYDIAEWVWDPEKGALPPFPDLRSLTGDYTLPLEEIIRNICRNLGATDETDLDDIVSSVKEREEWPRMQDGYSQLADEEARYRSGLAEYNTGLAQYHDALAAYDAGLAQYNAGMEAYNAGMAQYGQKEAEYRDGSSKYQENLASWENRHSEYEQKLSEYNENEKKYEDGVSKYEKAKKELTEGEKELAQKQKEYDDGSAKLKEAEKTLAEKQKSYREGSSRLEDAKEQAAKIQQGRWILVPRWVNGSWTELREVSRTFFTIGLSFALLFVLLGVLVCYATIGRVIDEQRKLVGTTKALGFTKNEIFGKYLIFGTLGTALGAVLGLLMAAFLLEPLITKSSELAFILNGIPTVFRTIPAVLAVAVALAVAFAAAYAACSRLLAQPATRLMSGEVPMAFSRKGKQARQSKSLYAGLILRNIVSDWKRVLVTVVSIAGCCMLLLIGFSLKQSFEEVIKRYFDETLMYDAVVSFLPEKDGRNVQQELERAAADTGASSVSIYQQATMMRVNDNLESVLLSSADPDEMQDCFTLRDAEDGKQMTIPQEGAVIFSRLAEVYGISVGDRISVMDPKGVFHEIPVAGIYRCYAGRTMFLSEAYMKSVFGDAVRDNTLAVTYQGAEEKDVEQKLKEIPGFLSFTDQEVMQDRYQGTVRLMNLVIAVLTAMAAIMAAVVLLNLVRIQINQKKREMTIMRVNGFTVRETILYILRENILTTLIGVGLGLLIGNFAAGFNLRAIDSVDLQMIRDFLPMPNLYSALITLGFAAAVNFIALREIRKLNLRDV